MRDLPTPAPSAGLRARTRAAVERLHEAAFANAERMDEELPDERADLIALLLPRAAVDALPETENKAELVRALLLDPAYQLN